jgi:hypothetical protein
MVSEQENATEMIIFHNASCLRPMKRFRPAAWEESERKTSHKKFVYGTQTAINIVRFLFAPFESVILQALEGECRNLFCCLKIVKKTN